MEDDEESPSVFVDQPFRACSLRTIASINAPDLHTPEEKYGGLSPNAKRVFEEWMVYCETNREGTTADKLAETVVEPELKPRVSGLLKIYSLIDIADRIQDGNEVRYKPNETAWKIYQSEQRKHDTGGKIY